MKRVKYVTEYCHKAEDGSVENRSYENITIECKDSALNEAVEWAKARAYNGEVTVEEVADEDPTPATEPGVWDELDAAYQEGVDSV